MFKQILPPEVVCDSRLGDQPEVNLFPAEEAIISRAITARANEFRTARACAHRALESLGVPPSPILKGPHGEPIWPDGIVGSITHCDGFRCAAVARQSAMLALGIDVEQHAPLPNGTRQLVCTKSEREWIRNATTSIHWDKLFFSAKESVFKTWFPQTGQWMDHKEVTITISPGASGFHARLLKSRRTIAHFAGKFIVDGAHLGTAITIAQGQKFAGPR